MKQCGLGRGVQALGETRRSRDSGETPEYATSPSVSPSAFRRGATAEPFRAVRPYRNTLFITSKIYVQ